MVKLLDRVKQAVSGTASSTTLGAAAEGFRTFNTAGAATNDVCRYAIEDDNGAFEIGTIVINSATTGTRTVQISSNSNNALTLTGNAVIFATLSAADLSGNAAPIWTTTPPSNIDLNNDGSTAVTLAGVAIDEFPVHYSWDGFSGTTVYDADSLPPQLSSAPTFSGGTVSLIGSSTSSNAGVFNFRLKASDGVKTATAITAVNLEFFPQSSNLVARHEIADISGSTWSDSSVNSVDLTISSGTGGYNSSGNLNEPVLELASGNAGKYLAYDAGDFSTVKTFLIIFQPMNTNLNNVVLSDENSAYNGISRSGVTYTPYSSLLVAWPGTTRSITLNGASKTTAGDLFSGYVGDKFNSLAFRNFNFGSGTYRIHSFSNYKGGMAVKAIYTWSVALTDAELKTAHETHSQMVTWST